MKYFIVLYLKAVHKLIIRTPPTNNKYAEDYGLAWGQLKPEI